MLLDFPYARPQICHRKILLFIDCIGNFGGTGTLLLIRAAGCHRAPHSRMVVQPAGDCSSSVLYRARLARRALRVPARGGCRRWWYSHPKHTGPCLSPPFSQRSCPQWDLPTAVWLSSAAHYPRSSFSGGVLEHIKSARSARFGLLLEHSGWTTRRAREAWARAGGRRAGARHGQNVCAVWWWVCHQCLARQQCSPTPYMYMCMGNVWWELTFVCHGERNISPMVLS